MKSTALAILVATLGFSASAWATDPPPRVGATKPLPAAEQAKAKDKEKQKDKLKDEATAKPGPAKKPQRRAVYQQFDELPMRTPPTAVYAPTLTPRDDIARDRLLPRVDPTPAPPVTINCVGAACSDASGGSYRGGVGTSLINQDGRICNNNGITVQCH